MGGFTGLNGAAGGAAGVDIVHILCVHVVAAVDAQIFHAVLVIALDHAAVPASHAGNLDEGRGLVGSGELIGNHIA